MQPATCLSVLQEKKVVVIVSVLVVKEGPGQQGGRADIVASCRPYYDSENNDMHAV